MHPSPTLQKGCVRSRCFVAVAVVVVVVVVVVVDPTKYF